MLVFFCGKMGAGKSTRAAQIAAERNAVLISEDDWLGSLFPGEIKNLKDYVNYAKRIKPIVKDIAQRILVSGGTVVLDFPANTTGQREWLKSIYSEVGASHELVYINEPDDVCLARIAQRRAENPERQRTDTKEMFYQVSKYFEEPSESEGFNIVLSGGHA